jgi:hypothetical protein
MGGLPKKKCFMEGPFAQGGGPAESHREYYVGDAACEGGAGNRRTARSEPGVDMTRGKACQLDPGKLEEGTGKWMRGARVAQV